jgi:CBS domain-containing protein
MQPTSTEETPMRPAARVGDLMSTALICVRETDTIGTALQEMRQAVIHHLPVVDEHLNLVGVLSSSDVLDGRRALSSGQRIGRSMSRSVVTVTPDTSAARAMDLMTENVFRSLPVVDSDGHLVGILTDTDLRCGSRTSPGDPGDGDLG